MRSSSYARTPPESCPVFVVRLVVVIMARNLGGACIGVNGFEMKNLLQ
jgi:hypothetical protein